MDNSKEILMRQLSRVIKNEAVLSAFKKVDRKEFVPEGLIEHAYADRPLPIGEGATISQPTTVAIMTESLDVKKGQKILEIGTGSGYQAAILSKLVGESGKVCTVEINKGLCERAMKNLKGYKNVRTVCGSGHGGLIKYAPFDRIIVTAAAPVEPLHLLNQLKDGGILLVPVGIGTQKLKKYVKKKDSVEVKDLGHFAFVPLRKT